MDDHADVDERRGKEVRYGYRIKCDGNSLRHAVRPNQPLPKFTSGRQYAASNLVRQVRCKQARVKCRQRLAFRLQNLPEKQPKNGDVRVALAPGFLLPALVIHFDDYLRPGLGSNSNDMLGINYSLCLASDGLQQRLTLHCCVKVRFIQCQQNGPPLRYRRLQRIEFCIRDVAVDNENDQVGSTRNLFCQRLSIFTTRFIQAGCINQINATGFQLTPGLDRRMPGFSVHRADGEPLFTDERVKQG